MPTATSQRRSTPKACIAAGWTRMEKSTLRYLLKSSPQACSLLIVLCALAASCATLRAPLGSRTWNSVCYEALRQDVDHLAGSGAYDCGLLRLDAAQGAQSQITACAKQAVADGGAYRFGYQSAGD